MRCLIVEDEPLAAEVLEDYIRQVPQLELVATCEDAIYALEWLQRERIDVIFLDIHLPKLKGLEFLKTLNNPPKVILTTAYHQYALQSYALNVVDYLLKPIEFSRFLQAVNKLQAPNTTATNTDTRSSDNRPYRFFNVNKKMVKVFWEEICYIESIKEYVKIYTPEHVITTKYQLGELEKELPSPNFLRVHRSFIIAVPHIQAFTATDIEIQHTLIPIGRSYKQQVLHFLETL